MQRHGQALMLLAALVVALTACEDSPTEPAPQPAFGRASSVSFIVWPNAVELAPGQTQTFGAYVSTQGTGFGTDGVPGTADDGYQPATALWSVVGDIGEVSPSLGTSTTFGASLPERRAKARGRVVANLDGGVAEADIQVVGDSEPIADRKIHATFTDGRSSKTFDHDRSVRFYVDFASTGAKATFEGGTADAPAGATKAEVRFTNEKVSGLAWYGETGLLKGVTEANGSSVVKFEFPGGRITGAQWGGSQDVGLPKGKTYNAVTVRYE